MSSNSPCAACKFLRRKCTQECVFAPYFPPEHPAKFATVHKVFGASNVAKILSDIPPQHREGAANSLAYEADARLRDPVHGCVGVISFLQDRLKQMHIEMAYAKQELAAYVGPSDMSAAAGLPPTMLHHNINNPAFGQQQQLQLHLQQMMEAQQMMSGREHQEYLRNFDPQALIRQQMNQQQHAHHHHHHHHPGQNHDFAATGFNNNNGVDSEEAALGARFMQMTGPSGGGASGGPSVINDQFETNPILYQNNEGPQHQLQTQQHLVQSEQLQLQQPQRHHHQRRGSDGN